MSAIPPTRLALIRRIATAARGARSGRNLPAPDAFVREYFCGVSEEDLRDRPVRGLALAGLAHLRFGQRRPHGRSSDRRSSSGRPLVRVYQPQLAIDGWESPHTIVEVITDDMPFLVDSVAIALQNSGVATHLTVHPILHVRRDGAGNLQEVVPEALTGAGASGLTAERVSARAANRVARGRRGGGPERRESWQHVEIDRVTDTARCEQLRLAILATLEDVRLAFTDWSRMRSRMQEISAGAQAVEAAGRRPVGGSSSGVSGKRDRRTDRGGPAESTEQAEIQALLEWLVQDHFIFLGYREYRLRRGSRRDSLESVASSSLGILRPRSSSGPAPAVLSGELREHARNTERLFITKDAAISRVHRATYLDYIGVRTFDDRGRVVGEHRFVGLFTSSAYNLSPREIPLLRRKVQQVVAQFGLAPDSHDGKALLQALETYPREELFQTGVPALIETVRGIVNLYERTRVRLFMRRDPLQRFYSCLIYVPRDRYSTRVREQFETILLDALHGASVESQVQLSESRLARVFSIVRTIDRATRTIDLQSLEKRLATATRTWRDRLGEALVGAHDEAVGLELLRRYQDAFPLSYQEDVAVDEAVRDIAKLELLRADRDAQPMRRTSGNEGSFHLRVFRQGAPIVLSAALPAIENLGLTVIGERSYKVELPSPVWLHDFEVQTRGPRLPTTQNAASAVAGKAARPVKQERTSAPADSLLLDALAAIWNGAAENDGFNQLVLAADLGWREVVVLRAYCRYLQQTGVAFSQGYMQQTLARYPQIAGLLLRIFAARFDPAPAAAARTRLVGKLDSQLAQQLDAIANLDEDRILRTLAAVVAATVRTNYFQHSGKDQSAVRPSSVNQSSVDPSGLDRTGFGQWSFDQSERFVIKLRSRAIAHLPLPRPLYEVFVYSTRVEAIHMRMGPVARGGLRWSDRKEDFRTEILGLMKAQNVKNTLIVPVGAKGGFVCKALAADAAREDVQREVIDCYRTFIRGLLDITDNIVDGHIVPPRSTVREDGDDPYLVVAADKGTATFSDVANGIAAEYGFWLGDAFASGGSVGYDHKQMGITARGAWECVKRHFRELGVDTQSQDFTVVGIGDMSGDVFGNGLLQSKHMRLLAAFNHQHVFLDPNPDVARTYRERERLFKLPRSTWADYDAGLISKGGGVYPRSLKSIPLSPPVRAMLGIDAQALSPPELIRAILRMPVDLLWNGGIGTYVKAGEESHADVGDRTNDAVRVDGRELRCRVVGEGGNLGLTQRGRIEYAQSMIGMQADSAARVGALNTDFIDNSAGVDCSDHEVNIKILLELAHKRAGLTRGQRDRLLAAMTDEVAELVLRDNYLQGQALSIAQSVAVERLEEHGLLIRSLEVEGVLDRTLEFLPSVEELAERRKAGGSLTRPELSVLLAYGKIALYGRLIDSDVPEDPYLRRELDRYFPQRLSERYAKLLPQHRLRREIIVTATTNSLVNRMGPSFARRAEEDTGADAATLARAYTIAREAFDMRPTWTAIEALDNRVAAATQYEMMLASSRLLQFSTYWLIRRQPDGLNIDRQVAAFKPGLEECLQALPQALTGLELERLQTAANGYIQAGVPDSLARRVALLEAARSGPDIVQLAAEARAPVRTVTHVYFDLAAALGLDWMRLQTEGLLSPGHWQGLARTSLRDEIFNLQRVLTLQALRSSGKRAGKDALQKWLQANAPAIAHVRQAIAAIRALPAPDFATLSVGLQSLRRLSQ